MLDDDPVLERTQAPRCHVDGCNGKATDGTLCLFHANQSAAPRATVTPIRPPAAPPPIRTSRPPRPECPHCGKECASELGVRFHIELKHPEHVPPKEYQPTMSTVETPATSPAYPCTEPGCDFVSTRPNGLTRHRNQTHGMTSSWPHPHRAAPPEPKPARNNARAEPEPTVTPDPELVSAEPLVDAETDELGVAIAFSPAELDILDACAFLDGVDRYQLVSGLLTEWIQLHAVDPDVNLCVTARRARTTEATE